MAQLKDSIIDGNLEVSGEIVLQTTNTGVTGTHPETGEPSKIIHMSNDGNTVVGYGGYANQNGNSHIYGNDVYHYVASAGHESFRPYYRAGDVLEFNTNNTCIRTVGYVTNSMKNLVFTIPLSKPIIGSPTAQVTESDGFVLRQGNTYTHGSAAEVLVKPEGGYDVFVNPNVGLVVTAYFETTTNATNNDSVGIYWNGVITLS